MGLKLRDWVCAAAQSVLLFVNGVAVLSNERFLEKCELP